MEESIHVFNSVCSKTIDLITPLKQVNARHKLAPWFNKHIHSLRRICRRCERKWNKDQLQISYEMLRDSLSKFQKAVRNARSRYFTDLLEKNHHNPRALFSAINSIINPRLEVVGDLSVDLCNSFLKFFMNRTSDNNITRCSYVIQKSVTGVTFPDFEPISLSMLEDIILKLKSTTSPQDIVPTHLLKQVIN